jgi:hypothetical protein
MLCKTLSRVTLEVNTQIDEAMLVKKCEARENILQRSFFSLSQG